MIVIIKWLEVIKEIRTKMSRYRIVMIIEKHKPRERGHEKKYGVTGNTGKYGKYGKYGEIRGHEKKYEKTNLRSWFVLVLCF